MLTHRTTMALLLPVMLLLLLLLLLVLYASTMNAAGGEAHPDGMATETRVRADAEPVGPSTEVPVGRERAYLRTAAAEVSLVRPQLLRMARAAVALATVAGELLVVRRENARPAGESR
jgi:hypothetical protein